MAINITVYPLYSPRIIQVDIPQVAASVQDLINAIRDWEDSEYGQYFPTLIDAAGKEELGDGVTVGITATLQDAQVYFPSRSTPIDNTQACTTGDTAGRVLISVGSTFQSDGLVRGDAVYNSSTGAMSTIITVDSEIQLTMLPLTGGSRNDWQVADGVVTYNNPQCDISGGNLVSVDSIGDPISAVLPSPLAQVVRTAASSATATELEAIQYASYGDVVSLDVINGAAGTSYPVGNKEYPVNNVADAVTIAANTGLDTIEIIGDVTFTTGDNVSGLKVRGQNPILTTIIIESGANVLDCQFNNANILNSTLDGNSWLQECIIENLTYVEGRVERCMMSGNIEIAGTDDTFFVDCTSGCVGQGAGDLPVVDIGGSGRNLAFRNWSGPVKLTNLTGANTVCVDVTSGSTIILDSTLTDGTIYIRGIADIIDGSNGTTVSTDAMINKTVIWEQLISTPLPEGSYGAVITDIWEMLGLDIDNPITISTTQHLSTGVDVTITDNGNGTVTLQRQ